MGVIGRCGLSLRHKADVLERGGVDGFGSPLALAPHPAVWWEARCRVRCTVLEPLRTARMRVLLESRLRKDQGSLSNLQA
jgi:hypothetical protein